jgi:hypothetical protein
MPDDRSPRGAHGTTVGCPHLGRARAVDVRDEEANVVELTGMTARIDPRESGDEGGSIVPCGLYGWLANATLVGESWREFTSTSDQEQSNPRGSDGNS